MCVNYTLYKVGYVRNYNKFEDVVYYYVHISIFFENPTKLLTRIEPITLPSS
jgi:hypothetical protein